MDGLIPAMPEGAAAQGAGVALDLVPPLTPYLGQSGLSIRVERLPFKARLSQGRNNGDNTWSLTTDDLVGLLYLPPEGLTAAHTLTVRVIRIADDTASTLTQFDVPVSPGGATPAPSPAATPMSPGAADYGAPAEPAPHMPAPYGGPADVIQEQGDPGGTGLTAEPDQRFAAEKASWEVEQQERIAAAVRDAVQRAGADVQSELSRPKEPVPASEMNRHLDEARASWEAEQQEHIAAAVRTAEADIRAQMHQDNEMRMAEVVERRLTEARASWEDEYQAYLSEAVQEAARKARAETAAQMDQTNDSRMAEEVERRLAEARAAWEAEHQAYVAAAVQEAVHRAEADVRAQQDRASAARLAQEVEHQLAEARSSWEAELQVRVASAVQDAVQRSEMDARMRLEQAEREWREISGRELADMSARCAHAEAALAEANRQPPQGQENEAEIRRLRDDLATAQASIAARETEVAELQQSLERAASEMSGRGIEAQADYERGRAAWHAEREDLVNQFEENAQQRVRQALERWQQETQEALERAKQEWAKGEEMRLALAEAKWRENMGFAKARAPITKMMKRGRRMRIADRFKLVIAGIAFLVVVAIVYPRLHKVVTDRFWPSVVEYKAGAEPKLRQSRKKLEAWWTDVMKRAKEEAARRKKKQK